MNTEEDKCAHPLPTGAAQQSRVARPFLFFSVFIVSLWFIRFIPTA